MRKLSSRRLYWFIAVLALTALLPVATQSQTNFAVLTSDGAWTWYNDPRALFHNGILYFGYVRFSDGKTVLSAFNPIAGATTELWASGFTQKDDHNNPGLLVREDGKMLAIYARHGTDQFFAYRLSTSTNPSSPAVWAAEQSIPATGAGLTYANPYQLSAEGGRIYDYSRNLNFNPTVFTSDDGGATWSAPQLFIHNGSSGNIRPYVKYGSDYTDRIEFLYTDGHPRDVTNSLYHLYYRAGAYYKTDGTFVKSFDTLPILHDSGERGSVIYQYSAAATSDPNDHIPTGRAWCWEVVPNTNGPVCVFTVQRDQVTGTNWFDDRIYYYYARWTGSSWQKRFIAHAGRPLYQSEDDYAGGICIDPNDPATIYISSNAADPFNLGDTTNVPLNANQRYELWRGCTTDGGLTFTWTPVTTNSAVDNLRPYIPRRQTGTPAVIWFRGVYSTFTSYNCQVVGLFPMELGHSPVVAIQDPRSSLVTFTNLKNQLVLSAAASDDGLPDPLSISWTTLSGPSNAVFSDPFATDTTVSFPLPGSYVLRIRANDGASSAFSDVTVNAGPLAADAADSSRALWLKFDESSGAVANDSSAYGNSGFLSGSAVWRPTEGMRAGALSFDGTSAQVVVTNSASLMPSTSFTVAWWFRADAYPADSGGLVSKRDGISSNNTYTTWLKTTDKRIYVDIDGSNNRFSSSTLIGLGSWYHVAVVFDGSLPSAQRAGLWINGKLDVIATESSATISNYPANVRIGNTHPGAVNWFNGLIDDVRFYQRALSPSEIVALASTNVAPSVTITAVPPLTNGLPGQLVGAALDDGRGGPLNAWWTQVDGPGNLIFSNTNSLSIVLTAKRSGSYIVRLSANDGLATICQDTNVYAAPNTNAFEDWIAAAFPGSTNPAVIGIAADPDGDRALNLLEFALGTQPGISDARNFTTTEPGLPRGSVALFNGTNYLSLLVRRPTGRLAIDYQAEVSSDLQLWSPAVLAGPAMPNNDGTETITFRDILPTSAATQRYIRLKVIKTE